MAHRSRTGLTFVLVMVWAFTAHGALFTVTNINDAGPGSLRDAITQANMNPGPDIIDFNIPGTGPHTIMVQTPLPAINDTSGGVMIDGLTQPGAFSGPAPPATAMLMIVLDGSLIIPQVPPPNYSHGLWVLSSNNTIQGLVIQNFPHDGICIQGTPGGTINNMVFSNFVGTDVTGQIAMPNGWHVGFPGSLWAGVYIVVTPYIIGVAQQNVIDGNLISGNSVEGVGIANCPPGDVSMNSVTNNRIGTDLFGLFPVSNLHDGVYIGEGAHDNLVAHNLISGNLFDGVGIVGYDELSIYTYANIVDANIIGADINLMPMGNAMNGVNIGAYGAQYLGGFATDNIVTNNTISWNVMNGVRVWEHTRDTVNGDRNLISQNDIYDNGWADPGYLGIDLDADGLSLNDPGDPDPTANQCLNFPVILSAAYLAGTTTVTGVINIDSNTQLATVELFRAKPDTTGLNHGQGERFLGVGIPDALGNWTAVISGIYPGELVTATTTDLQLETSEFAFNVPVTGEEFFDYGDAPDPSYPTLMANNGPRHASSPLMLGGSWDSEPDGQPEAQAFGDDMNGVPDEDGVQFMSLVIPGRQALIRVMASGPGYLDAWIDYNADGGWWQVGDRIFNALPVIAGQNDLVISVPPTATPGILTFSRFRLSSNPAGLPFTGTALDGEVEDHLLAIDELLDLDFGDAPDGPYPTTIASNGACHVVSGTYYLGGFSDAEIDGQPDANATGDDLAGGDDEDGVMLTSVIMPNGSFNLDVVASVAGTLDGWVDWHSDGSWGEIGDRILAGQYLLPGLNQLSVPAPANATPGPWAYARFRFTATGCASYEGVCASGEVEDYRLAVDGIFADGFESGDTSAW